MTHRETNKATLEIEIDGIGRVNEIHRELCKTNIVQIKSKRNQINKKLQNSAIDLTHLVPILNEETLNTLQLNALMPIIQPYKGTISHYSLTQQDVEQLEKIDSKAVQNITLRRKCIKCDMVGCFVRRHQLPNGNMGFIKKTTGGLCGSPYTVEEAHGIQGNNLHFDNSNLPAFNHKITMMEIAFLNNTWVITPVYKQPNKQLFQYTGMKGVTAVANQKQIAPMYRRNLSISNKQKQIYHQCAVGFFGNFYALVMINHNHTDDAKVTFDYPPVGVINNIGIKGGEQ